MKTLKYITLCALALTSFASCEDEYEIPSEFSDVSWYTSSKTDQLFLAENSYLSFMDLSQGELSHQWIVSADSADGQFAFLGMNIPAKPDTITDHIDPSIQNGTSNKTISVLFQKAGTYKVRLFNTFERPVTFNGLDTLTSHFDESLGAYVIDTAFTVRAFGKLEPEFAVFSDDSLTIPVPFGVDEAGDTLTYQVEAGGKLYFVDLTKKDQPTGRTWICGGAFIPSPTDSICAMSFNALGNPMVSLRAVRDGNNYPTATAQRQIPLKIKVVPSSIPFENMTAVELKDETIQLAFNGEITPESLTGKEADFSVHVFNEAAGFDQIIPVQGLSLDPTNATLLNVKLAQKIYRTDSVRVSYIPGADGAIMSSDFRSMTEFGNKWVTMHQNNLCTSPIFKFEGDAAKSWLPDWDNAYAFELVDDPLLGEENKRWGPSLMVDMSKNTMEGKTAFKISCTEGFSTIKKNTEYTFTFKVFIPAETTIHKACNIRMMVPYNWSDVKQMWTDLKKLEPGKWNVLSHTLNFTEDKIGRSFNIQVADAEVNGVIYFDDFSVLETENRPANN